MRRVEEGGVRSTYPPAEIDRVHHPRTGLRRCASSFGPTRMYAAHRTPEQREPGWLVREDVRSRTVPVADHVALVLIGVPPSAGVCFLSPLSLPLSGCRQVDRVVHQGAHHRLQADARATVRARTRQTTRQQQQRRGETNNSSEGRGTAVQC